MANLGDLLNVALKNVGAIKQTASTVAKAAPKLFNQQLDPKLQAVVNKPKVATPATPSSTAKLFSQAVGAVQQLPTALSNIGNNVGRLQTLQTKAKSGTLTVPELNELNKLGGNKPTSTLPATTISAPTGQERTWAELPSSAQNLAVSKEPLSLDKIRYAYSAEATGLKEKATKVQDLAAQVRQWLPNSAGIKAVPSAIEGAITTPLNQFATGIDKLTMGGVNSDPLAKPKIVQGLGSFAFGGLSLTPAGAAFNAVLAQPELKPAAEAVFKTMDDAKEALVSLPIFKYLPDEAKDAIKVGVDLVAFHLLHKAAELPFKTKVNVMVENPVEGGMMRLSLPADRQWWSNMKTDLNNSIGAIKKDPIGFLKELPIGASIKDISKNPEAGKLPNYKTPEQIKAEASDKYVKEMVKKAEEARKNPIKNTVLQHLSNWTTAYQKKFEDVAAGVEKQMRKNEMQYGYRIQPKDSFTGKYDKSMVATDLAAQFMKDNGLGAALSKVATTEIDAFKQYLVARQSKDLEGQGHNTGRDLAKDQQLIDTHGPKFEEAAKQVTDYANKLLDYSAESGLISKDLVAKLKEQYPNYVPINRIFSALEEPATNYKSTMAPASISSSKSTGKLTEAGSSRQIEDPIHSLLDKTITAHQEATRNIAATALIDMGKLPGWEGVFEPLRTAENISKRADLFSELKNSKVIKNIVESALSRVTKSANEIGKQINALNKEGLNIKLKQEEEVAPTVQSKLQIKQNIKEGTVTPETGSEFKVSYPDSTKVETLPATPTKRQLISILDNLIKETPARLETIQKRITNKESGLNVLIEQAKVLQEGLADISKSRKNTYDEAALLKEASSKGKETISRLVDGIKEVWAVPKDIAAFAKAYDVQQLDLVSKASVAVSRIFKAGTTGVNVPFAVANLVKDVGTALVNSRHAWKGLANPKIVGESIGAALGLKPELLDEVQRAGVFGVSADLFRDNKKLNVESIKAQESFGANVNFIATHPSQWVRAIEDAISVTEKYTRINVFQTTKKEMLSQGMSKENATAVAADEARNATANFRRRGELYNTMRAFNPYINAAFRGAAALRRGLSKQSPTEVAAKVTGYLVVPSTAITLWNTSDPEREKIYKSIKQYDKDNYWIVVLPGAKINDKNVVEGVVKIPKPPGWSAVANITERTVNAIKQTDEPHYQDMVMQFLGAATGIDATSPISQITPQAIKGPIEAFTGKSLYTGGAIPNKDISGTLKKIDETTGLPFGMSPAQAQYLAQSYGGEVGLQALNAVDQVAAGAGVISKEDIGARDIGQSFQRRFSQAPAGAEQDKIFQAQDQAKQEAEKINGQIKDAIGNFIDNGDDKKFMEFASSLPPDKQKYLMDQIEVVTLKKQIGNSDYKINQLNGKEAVIYWKDDMDAAIASGDMDSLSKILARYKKGNATYNALLDYLSQKAQNAPTQ